MGSTALGRSQNGVTVQDHLTDEHTKSRDTQIDDSVTR
jgi:hypothetical protein